MKTKVYSYCTVIIAVLLAVACSVKKDRALNRGYHALTSKYNILFHGNEGYNEALASLKQGYFDDYWEILPIERIDIKVDPEKEFKKGPSLESKQGSLLDNIALDNKSLGNGNDEAGGSGFQLAESKAVKAIQKHSMYIRGREKNSQMDEAYLLLGKTRYYDGRFIPALEAFNYILYKYPDSDKIDESKVWREKTNLRLRYYDLAVKNMKELIRDKKTIMKKQVASDAYATLAQGYIHLAQLDSAATSLKKAVELTKNKEEYARYTYILGQLYSRLGKKEEANATFQEVINLNRRSPRGYVIHAHAEQFLTKGITAKDSVTFLRQYRKLMNDRENREYLDVLNRQVGVYYEMIGNNKKALEYLKTAVKKGGKDEQLKAKNFISIAEIYFNTAGYAISGQYFDSALAILPPKAKETFRISKRRESLRDVVEYEATAKKNDSILRVLAMSTVDRQSYYQKYVDELRKEDFRKLQKNLKGKGKDADFFNMPNFGDAINQAFAGPDYSTLGGKKTFYFYSTQASSFGKVEFKKRWGNRPLVDDWRWKSNNNAVANLDTEAEVKAKDKEAKDKIDKTGLDKDPRYDIATYMGKLPTDSIVIAKLKDDRDFAYFQLGAIYSERFKKYERGADRLESLLTFNPAERLVLPAMYKLYKIYLEIDAVKANKVKERIIANYPDSRYAKLMQNLALNEYDVQSPETYYSSVYKSYQEGEYMRALNQVDMALVNIDNEEYVSKFELLKANILGRIEGVSKYKEALNFLALTYSATPEGKEANRLLETVIPALEGKEYGKGDGKDWKAIVVVPYTTIQDAQEIRKCMESYASHNKGIGIKFSIDFYSKEKVLLVLHGFKSEEGAKGALSKCNAGELVVLPMQTDDYIVLQIKKDLEDYLKKSKGVIEVQ
ncbi:MAG: tetratricopeptide repeat protein [Flavobacteriaceae bacterium]|nr:tetratricopeptide repeat protein [Flavobacteriaceae bacterium]